MKKVLKIILIAIGSFIALAIIVDLFTSDEKKAQYEKERQLRDSLKILENKKIEFSQRRKILIFNDINSTITTLSANGLGQLHSWKSDEMGSWVSNTEYFILNENQYGLGNNIAYYLESDNSDYIKTAKLILNINDKSNSISSIKTFKDLSIKTFTSLSILMPDSVIQAIDQNKEIVFENKDFISSVLIDKSSVDTWKLIIESK